MPFPWDSSEWEEAFRLAVSETATARLGERIQTAHAAITARFNEIEHSAGDREEVGALIDARHALHDLEREIERERKRDSKKKNNAA